MADYRAEKRASVRKREYLILGGLFEVLRNFANAGKEGGEGGRCTA